ncbi:hypothetical protein K503DRAFT_777840, partial [Rhizopogon vinicolor AM-OR11-026]
MFTYDHLLAMGLCTHPSILSQHGQFLIHDSQSQHRALPLPAIQPLLHQTTRRHPRPTAGLVGIRR